MNKLSFLIFCIVMSAPFSLSAADPHAAQRTALQAQLVALRQEEADWQARLDTRQAKQNAIDADAFFQVDGGTPLGELLAGEDPAIIANAVALVTAGINAGGSSTIFDLEDQDWGENPSAALARIRAQIAALDAQLAALNEQ